MLGLGRAFFECTSPLLTYGLMGVRTHITMRMLLKHLKWTFISKYNKRGRRSGFPATRSLLCSSFVSKLHHDTNGIEAVSSGLHLEGRVSLMYDCSRQGHTNPMVTSFLSSPPKEETKQRRKGAARSLRPESLAGRYLRRSRSLRSLRQADRLTPPANFSPFGHRAPFKRAGSCTSAGPGSCIL